MVELIEDESLSDLMVSWVNERRKSESSISPLVYLIIPSFSISALALELMSWGLIAGSFDGD